MTVNWYIKNDDTGAQFGGYETNSAKDTNVVYGGSTVDYAAPIKRFTAVCTHGAYKKDSQGRTVTILSDTTYTHNY